MLRESHINQLIKESAISLAVIEQAELQSLDSGKAFSTVGLYKQGIGFPYFKLDGEFYGLRLRKDEVEEGEGRYHQQEGLPFNLYFLKTHIKKILDNLIPLYFVEGEKKLLSLVSNLQEENIDFAAVAFPGAFNWHIKGEKELAPIFKDIPLEGRLVKFIPDSDYFSNSMVKNSYDLFLSALTERGAIVHFIDLRNKEEV